MHVTTKHVYFDRKAFNVPTIVKTTDPVVSSLTCNEKVINGLVPKGIYLIFHGLSLSFVNIVANDFSAMTSAAFLNSLSTAFIMW